MLEIHFLISALWFSWYDLKNRLIKRKHLGVALVTIAPFTNLDGLKSGLLNLMFYLAIFLISRGAIGFGDVRLSLLIGLYLGQAKLGSDYLFTANFLSWLLAGLAIFLQRFLVKSPYSNRIAFAPFLFLGAALGVLA